MFSYIVKRILLIVPTLVLVSCVVFLMKSLVPTDPVETMLELQGMDVARAGYQEAYNRLSADLGYDLPAFYITIVPSDQVWLDGWEGSPMEQKLAKRWSAQGASQATIDDFAAAARLLTEREQRYILSSATPEQVLDKMSASVMKNATDSTIATLRQAAFQASSEQIKWHYPTVQWHGLANQYHVWISGISSGNFGVSLTDARPVGSKIWSAMRWTLVLVVLSLSLAILFSFPLAIYSATHPGSQLDRIITNFLFVVYSIPKFWMATMLIVFFTTAEYGGWTNIFPSVGIWRMGDGGFLGMLTSSWDMLVLPLIVIVVPDVAYLSRVIRASIVAENEKEYIKTARSKGMSESQMLKKHVIPNALLPTITLLAGVIPSALGSSLIVEVIFNIPGVGRLMYDSIRNADWAVVFPIVIVVSIVTMLTFLLADLLVARLNPKIKLGA